MHTEMTAAATTTTATTTPASNNQHQCAKSNNWFRVYFPFRVFSLSKYILSATYFCTVSKERKKKHTHKRIIPIWNELKNEIMWRFRLSMCAWINNLWVFHEQQLNNADRFDCAINMQWWQILMCKTSHWSLILIIRYLNGSIWK